MKTTMRMTLSAPSAKMKHRKSPMKLSFATSVDKVLGKSSNTFNFQSLVVLGMILFPL